MRLPQTRTRAAFEAMLAKHVDHQPVVIESFVAAARYGLFSRDELQTILAPSWYILTGRGREAMRDAFKDLGIRVTPDEAYIEYNHYLDEYADHVREQASRGV